MTGYKSSHRKCSIQKAVHKYFVIFKGKHLSWSLFLINLQAWRSANLLKRDSNFVGFLSNIAKFLRKPFLRNICERVLLRVLKPTSCLFLYPLKTSKNESYRYFQWVYKEKNGAEWVNKSLHKSKAIFVYVSVDQSLTSNGKDVKDLKLSDFLCRRVSIILINIKPWNFLFLSENHLFIGTFRNHILSENSIL